MAYAQGGTDRKGRIGLAESTDGIHWNRLAPAEKASILEPAEKSAWDDWFLDTPAILYHGGTWYLWYFGDSDNQSPGGAIGLATSTDGLHFTRIDTGPVLAQGDAGAWDSLWVESPTVIHDGTRFVMYYTGVDASWTPRAGRATSLDGVNWTKDPQNPVLSNGPRNSWNAVASAVPGVVFKGGEWQLFYCGIPLAEIAQDPKHPKIGWAYSADGRTFTPYPLNPVLDGKFCGYAPNGPYSPCVVFDDATGRYYLWYETGLGFGLVTAKH